MVTRFTASLLALVVLATSGKIGGVEYLCLMVMDGQWHSECCCKEEARTAANDECAEIVRADDCCDVRITKADHQLARVEASRHRVQPVSVLGPLPVIARVEPPTTQDASRPPGARASPSASGPPLFVWNCNYLI